MKLFLVGGFLGSGKTTAIVNACQYLLKNNYRVAVITNDQGEQQVDSELVKSIGIPSAEVTNGCFCCKYDQLDKHINSFIENIHPDVIFAESVGSCTDLIATVAKPFAFAIPQCQVVISVFAEACLLLALIEGRASFIKENIRYIYKKQIEEADILIINKIDEVKPEELDTINSIIKIEFPGKIILYQNSLEETEIGKWMDYAFQFIQPSNRSSIDINYELYGDGEAQLAWLDKSLIIAAPAGNAIVITNKIIHQLHDRIKQKDLVIGHLKFFIETAAWKKKVSITTTSPLTNDLLVNNNATQARLLINARIQTEPIILDQLVNETLKEIVKEYDCSINAEKWSAFKPGYPKPTHRIS